ETLKNVGKYEQTTIEDCLDPNLLYNAIKKSIHKDDTTIKNIFDEFEKDENYKSSRFSSENSLLRPKSLKAVQKKSILVDYIMKNETKIRIAENYKSLFQKEENLSTPEIFKLAKDFLS